MARMRDFDTAKLAGRKSPTRGYNQGTASGRPFWAADPRPEDIHIEDIARQLSRICRFGGAVRDEVEIYSVAQHSVLVSEHLPEELALEGLLHDAAEAYTGDMIKPIKHLCPDHVTLEKRVDAAIRTRFGLPEKLTVAVKEADYIAVATEWRDVYAAQDAVDWGPIADAYKWPEPIRAWLPSEAYMRFMATYSSLTGIAI